MVDAMAILLGEKSRLEQRCDTLLQVHGDLLEENKALRAELREAAMWNHRVRHLGRPWETCEIKDCARWRAMSE